MGAQLQPLPAIDPVVDLPGTRTNDGARVSGSTSSGRTTRAKSCTPTRLARTWTDAWRSSVTGTFARA